MRPSGPGGAGRGVVRGVGAAVSALALAAGSVLAGVPGVAVPPVSASHGVDAVTLVSNLGQAGAASVDLSGDSYSHTFRTGGFAGGYALSGVELRLAVTGTLSAADAAKVKVELWSSDHLDYPYEKLADLVVPSSLASGVVSFDAPQGTVLMPNTRYSVVVYASSALSAVKWTTTDSSAVDAGAASGWSLEAVAALGPAQTPVAGIVWSNASWSHHVAVKGYLLDHPGDLDPSVGVGGRVSSAFNTLNSEVHGLAEQADGKVVAVGYVQNATKDFALARYNRDGSLDTSFGSGGRVVTAIGSADDEARAVAVQDDGKIVVAGYASVGGLYDFALARYHTDGSLDRGFGQITGQIRTGKVIFSLGPTDIAHAVAVQSDGKIVVAGQAGHSFGVLRVHNQGDLDADVTADSYTGFGGDGKVTTVFTANVAAGARALAVQSDGKIVLAGYATNNAGTPAVTSDDHTDFALARYTTAGVLDTGFDADGKAQATLAGDEEAFAMAVQSNGKYVLAGSLDDRAAVARFHTSGILDGTFGEPTGSGNNRKGYRQVPFTGSSGIAPAVFRGLVAHSSGVLTAAGYMSDVADGDSYVLARFNADGDLSAGLIRSNATLRLEFSPDADQASRVHALLQTAGRKLVVGGYSNNGVSNTFALARTSFDGRPDTAVRGFGNVASGSLVTGFAAASEAAYGLVNTSRGAVVAGYTHNGTDEDFLVARYQSSGELDPDFGSGGKVVTDFGGNDRAFDVAEQSDGKIVVVGYATVGGNRDLAVVRYNRDGSLDTGFDTDGKVTIDAGSTTSDILVEEAHAVALQPDGKIVVAGLRYGQPAGDADRHSDTIVCRLAADGSIDGSGTSHNCTVVDVGSGTRDDGAFDVAIDSAGRIVTAGFDTDEGGINVDVFVVSRFTAGLGVDTSFGDTYLSGGFTIGTGSVITRLGFTGNNDHSRALAVAVQPDDRIVAAGYGGQPDSAVVARFTTAGVLDTTFSSDGWAALSTTGFDNRYRDLMLQPDGSVVAAGNSADTQAGNNLSYWLLARYNPDGTPDLRFGTAGVVRTNPSGGLDTAYAVALWSDRDVITGETVPKIVVAGEVSRAFPDYDIATLDRTEVGLAQYLGHSEVSVDASLSALSVASSTDGSTFDTAVPLTPAFPSDTTSHALGIGAEVTHVKVTPTVSHAAATVSVAPSGGSGEAVTSGTASAAIAIASLPVSVVVTAEDGATTRTYTLTRPPATLALSAANSSVGEGAGTVAVTATLNRRAPSGGVSVALTATGSATAGTDFVLPGAFTIGAGQTSATASVRIVDDDVTESDETVVVSASVSGWAVTPVTVTITDDDSPGVTLSTTTLTVFENVASTYTIRLNTQPTAPVTVTPASGTTAAATVSGALTFTAANWKSPQPVTVTGVAKGASTVTHTVSSSDSAYSGVSAGSVAVTVSEISTTYTITSAVTIPDDNTARSLTVTLGQTAPAGGITFAVAYDFSGGTAARGDLNEAPTTVTVSEGDTTAPLRLATGHDEVVEGDETFTVTITANAAAQAAGWTPVSGQNTATVTIADDDTASASVGFWSALEAQPDRRVAYRNTRARVQVVLNRPPAAPVTVEVEVDPSSTATEYVDAQNPGDFRIVDKTVTFTPGGGGSRRTSQSLWVDITNNAETASETIVLRIADHSGGGLGRHYTRYEPNREYTLELFPRTQSGTPRTPVDPGPVGPGPVGPVIGGGSDNDDDSGDDRDTSRLAGEDRYATSLRIAEQVAEANDGKLATIVLAGGHSWTDALTAAPLAGALDAALLLTAPGGLPADTVTWLEQIGVTEVIAVGDDTHITDAALETLRTALNNNDGNGDNDGDGAGNGGAQVRVERIAHDSPYAVSAAVATRIGQPKSLGPLLGRTVIVASGRTFPDALAAGPLAAAGPHPVLYADTGTLDTEVAAYLAANADHVIIMGGTAAISDAVEQQIRAIKQANRPARPMAVTRHAGTNRYHTAALFARWLTGTVLQGRVCFTADTAGLATGLNPADAAASGPLLAHRCAPLLLTEPHQMPPPTASYLRNTTELIIFGGTKAINNTALRDWTQ